MGALGRKTPTTWDHVEKYGFAALAPEIVAVAERTLQLPWWHWRHDQGFEGSCVGHGGVMERSITNLIQLRDTGAVPYTKRYDPIKLWNRAKQVDEWPDTNPGDDNGTSVNAAYKILRAEGPSIVNGIRMVDGAPVPYGSQPPSLGEGVSVNRWATSVDEIRTAIAGGLPVAIGVNWYVAFDENRLVLKTNGEYWISTSNLGSIRGGHCVCLYGASDRRQAFKLKNSWGRGYPLVWLPYAVMGRLLNEDGEAALVTDR